MGTHTITKEVLNERTMAFAVRIVRLVRSLPKGIAENAIAHQLIKSATSVGANYREACHAKSPNDFSAKLKICEGEAAETLYWLELIVNADIVPNHKMEALIREANELLAIMTAAAKSSYNNRK